MKRVPANRFFIFGVIVAVGLGWDLYSKHVVFADLGYPAGTSKPFALGNHAIFPHHGVDGESDAFLQGWITFRLYTSFNPGALWGLGQGYTWLFACLSVVAVIGVIYWLFVHRAAQSLWLTATLALIMAGTLGNLYDRACCHGYTNLDGESIFAVRDFLLFTFGDFAWPVFNFADMFLVTGAGMLILQSLGTEHPATTPAAEESEERSQSNSPAEPTRPT